MKRCVCKSKKTGRRVKCRSSVRKTKVCKVVRRRRRRR